MPTVSVFDMTGKKVSDIDLKEEIFGITPSIPAMHLCVVAYLANQRQGTQSTLTRSEVSGRSRMKSLSFSIPSPLTPSRPKKWQRSSIRLRPARRCFSYCPKRTI